MRIGLLVPSVYMSPRHYGDMIFAPRDLSIALADGLVDRGHEVTMFATDDIKTKARVVSGDMNLITKHFVETKITANGSGRKKWASFYLVKRNYELDVTTKCYEMARDGKLDIVHAFHESMSHFINELTGFPTVYTLHDPLPTKKTALFYWRLARFPKHQYVSISDAYRKPDTIGLNFVGTVYNGIDISEYDFNKEGGSSLIFMGRMVPEKGVHTAIDAAKQANIELRIATSNLEENKNLPYFTEEIEPRIKDTNLVRFVGFMNGKEKSSFFGGAKAFIFPIDWEEPFGLVMAEAMACGTPVIAYDRGSVSEVLRDGVTGFVVDQRKGVGGLVEAIKKIDEIDRSACRKHVEERFSVEKMVEGYEKVYQNILKL